ncbi:MAG: hypothetical protein JW708_01290 [Vallitaleaceae bacterium]|nr:hypothetical protein [Vallitaleaceae bacterium]
MGIRESQIQIEEEKKKVHSLPLLFGVLSILLLLVSGVLYFQKLEAAEEIQDFTEKIKVSKKQMLELDEKNLVLKEEYQELLDQKLQRESVGMKENYLNLDGSKNALYEIGLGYYAMESAFRYYLDENYSLYFEEYPEILFSKLLDGHYYYAVLKDNNKAMAFIYEIIFPLDRVSFLVLEETVVQEVGAQ